MLALGYVFEFLKCLEKHVRAFRTADSEDVYLCLPYRDLSGSLSRMRYGMASNGLDLDRDPKKWGGGDKMVMCND